MKEHSSSAEGAGRPQVADLMLLGYFRFILPTGDCLDAVIAVCAATISTYVRVISRVSWPRLRRRGARMTNMGMYVDLGV